MEIARLRRCPVRRPYGDPRHDTTLGSALCQEATTRSSIEPEPIPPCVAHSTAAHEGMHVARELAFGCMRKWPRRPEHSDGAARAPSNSIGCTDAYRRKSRARTRPPIDFPCPGHRANVALPLVIDLPRWRGSVGGEVFINCRRGDSSPWAGGCSSDFQTNWAQARFSWMSRGSSRDWTLSYSGDLPQPGD
jgi:hypothetical protein